MELKLDSVVCAGCTCLCDDLSVTVRNETVGTDTSCQLADAWFERLNVEPTCWVDGHCVDFDTAIERAVELLTQSHAPLVFGLDDLSTQSQIVAFEVANQVGAIVDTTATNGNRSRLLAMQQVGKVTASLGEIGMRSDLVVFWFCDPVVTHPRFIERYCKSIERMIVVSDAANATSRIADEFVQVGRDEIGAFISGVQRDAVGEGKRPTDSGSFAAALLASRYGAFVVGPMDGAPVIFENAVALERLVQTLNQITRVVSIDLRDDSNAQSAENVLAWSTGYPFAIRLSGDFPEYNGLEYSSTHVLKRRECDTALYCSGNAFLREIGERTDSPPDDGSALKQILITRQPDPPNIEPRVRFNVSFDEGDWCRMDDVSLPVANPTSCGNQGRRTARDVLEAILERLSQ